MRSGRPELFAEWQEARDASAYPAPGTSPPVREVSEQSEAVHEPPSASSREKLDDVRHVAAARDEIARVRRSPRDLDDRPLRKVKHPRRNSGRHARAQPEQRRRFIYASALGRLHALVVGSVVARPAHPSPCVRGRSKSRRSTVDELRSVRRQGDQWNASVRDMAWRVRREREPVPRASHDRNPAPRRSSLSVTLMVEGDRAWRILPPARTPRRHDRDEPPALDQVGRRHERSGAQPWPRGYLHPAP